MLGSLEQLLYFLLKRKLKKAKQSHSNSKTAQRPRVRFASSPRAQTKSGRQKAKAQTNPIIPRNKKNGKGFPPSKDQ
jgi:hypothetical protein